VARVPPLANRRPDVGDSLVVAIGSCLAPDPEDRWPDAAALADALDGFVVDRVRDPAELRVDEWLTMLFPEAVGEDETDELAPRATGESVVDVSVLSTEATSTDERPTARRGRRRWQTALVLLLLLCGAAWVSLRPTETAVPAQKTAQSAPPPAKATPVPAAPAAEVPAPLPSPPAAVAKPVAVKRRPPPRRLPDPLPAPAPAQGRLRVNADPAGEVWLDGELSGWTPLDRRLPAGRHTVRVVSQALGRSEDFVVEVPPDGEVQRTVRLRGPGVVPGVSPR